MDLNSPVGNFFQSGTNRRHHGLVGKTIGNLLMFGLGNVHVYVAPLQWAAISLLAIRRSVNRSQPERRGMGIGRGTGPVRMASVSGPIKVCRAVLLLRSPPVYVP